ncbi:MAG: hypothetical protein DRJ60_05295 [Thermoprotei archaeon]|nr:MAG: hypothetical protein DRJ60_05295 [Thermoprotei archaeon]
MRSLELACIIISLVALAEVCYHLVNPRPDLHAIARRLAYEVEHASGVKVIDIGLEALIIIKDGKLKLVYQGHEIEVPLRRKVLSSADYGPLITIHANATHVWLGQSYELKHGHVEVERRKTPVILYTVLPSIEFKLCKSYYEEYEEDPVRLKISVALGGFSKSWTSEHEYTNINFDIIIKIYISYGSCRWGCSGSVTISFDGSTVSLKAYAKNYKSYITWLGKTYYVGRYGWRTFKLKCRDNKVWLEGYPGSFVFKVDEPSEVRIKVSVESYGGKVIMDLRLEKLWGFIAYEKWSEAKRLDLNLKPSGLVGSLELKDASKVAFNIRPERLVIGGEAVTEFTYEDGWWVATIPSSEGSGKAYFEVELKEAKGEVVDYHYEYEVHVKRGILALIVPSSYDTTLVFEARELNPLRVYAYNATYLVYEYDIPKEGVTKIILKP